MIELNTFSIAARCERTGALGVAVASAVPAVGAICPYLVPGIGAASTQSWVNPYLAIETLELMRNDMSAMDSLQSVLRQDEHPGIRQIGLIGKSGRGVVHTGDDCTGWKGDIVGADFAIQGNMLAGEETLKAMRASWLATATEQLSERLMATLLAGDSAGGDKRGKQSASIKVVHKEDYATTDLRVDDHQDPVIELARIFTIAHQQLAPFVSSMPRQHGDSAPVSGDAANLLFLPPNQRNR